MFRASSEVFKEKNLFVVAGEWSESEIILYNTSRVSKTRTNDALIHGERRRRGEESIHKHHHQNHGRTTTEAKPKRFGRDELGGAADVSATLNRGGRSGEPAGWVHDATAAVAISATAKRGGELRSGGGVDLVRGHDAVEVVREQHVGISRRSGE